MENDNKTKWQSRKFIVWIVATVFVVASFILSYLTKQSEVLSQSINWWGGISTIYIGGNVASKIINDKVNHE